MCRTWKATNLLLLKVDYRMLPQILEGWLPKRGHQKNLTLKQQKLDKNFNKLNIKPIIAAMLYLKLLSYILKTGLKV